MIEVHDPYRLLVIVEQDPKIVLAAIQRSAATFEWFKNEWIHLVAHDPTEQSWHVLENGAFVPYEILQQSVPTVSAILESLSKTEENFPVVELQQKAS